MVREYEMATEKIQRIGKLNDWIARQRSEKPEDKCALSRMEPVVWSGQAVRYATAVDGQRDDEWDDGLRDGQGGGDGGKGRRGDQAGGRLQLRLRLRPLRESTRKSTSPTPSITPPIPRPNLSPPALRNLYKSRTADHLVFPSKDFTSPACVAHQPCFFLSFSAVLAPHWPPWRILLYLYTASFPGCFATVRRLSLHQVVVHHSNMSQPCLGDLTLGT